MKKKLETSLKLPESFHHFTEKMPLLVFLAFLLNNGHICEGHYMYVHIHVCVYTWVCMGGYIIPINKLLFVWQCLIEQINLKKLSTKEFIFTKV